MTTVTMATPESKVAKENRELQEGPAVPVSRELLVQRDSLVWSECPVLTDKKEQEDHRVAEVWTALMVFLVLQVPRENQVFRLLASPYHMVKRDSLVFLEPPDRSDKKEEMVSEVHAD